MTAEWPSTLPRPERNTFSVERQDARRRVSPSHGPALYRRQFTGAVKTVSLTVLLNADELAVFNAFYDDTTGGGIGLFYMPDPINDGVPLAGPDGKALLGQDGSPILITSRWLCMFGEQPPRDSRVDLETRVSFQVQVLPT